MARPKGSKSKTTLLREAQAEETLKKALALGITPLEYMLGVMRAVPKPFIEPVKWAGESLGDFHKRSAALRDAYDEYVERHEGTRMEAAKNAAPYVHPKLAQIEHKGDMKHAHELALAELE